MIMLFLMMNKKGEWVATFPKLKHEDLTRNELYGL